jgi:hypothetical protein
MRWITWRAMVLATSQDVVSVKKRGFNMCWTTWRAISGGPYPPGPPRRALQSFHVRLNLSHFVPRTTGLAIKLRLGPLAVELKRGQEGGGGECARVYWYTLSNQ